VSASASLDPLRYPATLLAADIGGLLLEARRLASAFPGLHGRRRAGQGEDFWQFRDHRREDGARNVDWRRSARGDRLFVREREMAAAQAAHLWVDPAPGFAWSADPAHRPTKIRRAQVMALALAMALVRGGERVGPLGGASSRGPVAPERLAEAWLGPQAGEPPAPPPRAATVLFSDFYAPISVWSMRLHRAAATGAHAALVAVADPAEEDFPFQGRVRFEDGAHGQEVLFGRAESARDAYQARLADHRTQLRALAGEYGFPLILHRTDRNPGAAFAELCLRLSERGP
jgi:uncharacterized protein (DUF58 family)